jgi:hypothetical protein
MRSCLSCHYIKAIPCGKVGRTYECHHPSNVRSRQEWDGEHEELLQTPDAKNLNGSCQDWERWSFRRKVKEWLRGI